jgi:hypothetical protein
VHLSLYGLFLWAGDETEYLWGDPVYNDGDPLAKLNYLVIFVVDCLS